MQKYDAAVIGGGASGLAFAVTLRKLNKNASIIIIEASDRLGRKIAATGNGQGNVSNADMSGNHYHGSGAHLAEKLCCGGVYNPLELFDFLFVTDKLGRIYPAGKQASALSDSLIKSVRDGGIEVALSTRVVSLSKDRVITLSDGEKIKAEVVVLAAGGKAQRQFNTDGNAFALAESVGHTVTPLFPSLVQLKCDRTHLKTLKGIRCECAVTVSGGDKPLVKTFGDVLFTDGGVSGNAIFYASSYCAGRDDITLKLEFLPEISEDEIARAVAVRKARGYPQSDLLCGTLHNQIARTISRRCLSDDPEALARLVKNFTLAVTGTLGFDYAQVTRGGVPASEINEDLESKKAAGLYIVGEAVDVDGDCGGYNLHWAFASGICAAHAAAEKLSRGGDGL